MSAAASAAGARNSASPLIWGVLNTTPDSFSDGGHYADVEAAIARAEQLVSQGADVIDVGGESTRPGATPVPRDEELARVIPVIEQLVARGIVVSIDTIHAETAAAAVRAGATYINDVSGGLNDADMLAVAAKAGRDSGALFVIGHWRGIPDTTHERSTYADVVTEVRDALEQRANEAIAAGLSRELIVLDPGLGFDKTGEQCWQILGRMNELHELGYPLLIGASRKRMLADVLATVPGAANAPLDRDLATSMVSGLSARAGAWGVRVHDVAGTAQAIAVERAWRVGSHRSDAGSADMRAAGAAADRYPTNATTPVDQVPATPVARDRITLTGLEVFAHHGVFDFERENGQRFLIDAELAVDLKGAADSDDLDRTVHYGELADQIVAAVAADPVDLIETVAERVMAVAMSFVSVQEAKITVNKPEAPIAHPFVNVSVTLVRTRGEQ